MDGTVMVAKPGQAPMPCLDDPKSLQYARSLGYVVVDAPGSKNSPDDILLVSADGGKTTEQCRRDGLPIAYKRGMVPVGDTSAPSKPNVIKPKAVRGGKR